MTNRNGGLIGGLASLGLVFAAATVQADGFHNPPLDFMFGNNIDSHQETHLATNRHGDPKRLYGYFYIKFTGETDEASGLPVAKHPSGTECTDTPEVCVTGWIIKARPGKAKFLYHDGINTKDHPVWLVNRIDIPQPGSFTHFHWIGSDSTDPRSLSVPTVCDVNSASALEPDAVDSVCPGWFMQIRAVRNFAFKHGNEVVPVHKGIDNSTHLNLVTDYEEVTGITPTRP